MSCCHLQWVCFFVKLLYNLEWKYKVIREITEITKWRRQSTKAHESRLAIEWKVIDKLRKIWFGLWANIRSLTQQINARLQINAEKMQNISAPNAGRILRLRLRRIESFIQWYSLEPGIHSNILTRVDSGLFIFHWSPRTKVLKNRFWYHEAQFASLHLFQQLTRSIRCMTANTFFFS